MGDQRGHERYPLSIDIRVIYADGEETILESMDISNGGVFLRKGDGRMPDDGEEVKLQIADPPGGQARPVIPSRVVRRTEQGIGLEYLLD